MIALAALSLLIEVFQENSPETKLVDSANWISAKVDGLSVYRPELEWWKPNESRMRSTDGISKGDFLSVADLMFWRSPRGLTIGISETFVQLYTFDQKGSAEIRLVDGKVVGARGCFSSLWGKKCVVVTTQGNEGPVLNLDRQDVLLPVSSLKTYLSGFATATAGSLTMKYAPVATLKAPTKVVTEPKETPYAKTHFMKIYQGSFFAKTNLKVTAEFRLSTWVTNKRVLLTGSFLDAKFVNLSDSPMLVQPARFSTEWSSLPCQIEIASDSTYVDHCSVWMSAGKSKRIGPSVILMPGDYCSLRSGGYAPLRPAEPVDKQRVIYYSDAAEKLTPFKLNLKDYYAQDYEEYLPGEGRSDHLPPTFQHR